MSLLIRRHSGVEGEFLRVLLGLARNREQRLKSARELVAARRERQREFLVSQVATIQELANKGIQMPVPTRLLASFGRLPLLSAVAASG